MNGGPGPSPPLLAAVATLILFIQDFRGAGGVHHLVKS